MSALLAIYLLGAIVFIVWTAVKTWRHGWDPQWPIGAQSVLAAVWALLWPIAVVWIAFAVFAAAWDRRGY